MSRSRRRYDSILFDFDGVLSDSEPLHYGCWLEVLRPLGIEFGWDDYIEHCLGVSDRETVDYFGSLAAPPIDGASLIGLYPAKKALFRRKSLETPPLLPALREFLAALGDYKLAVVSSSARDEIRPLLEKANVESFFGAQVYGEDVERLKPAPDPYQKAAVILGARRPLVVEDSEPGIQSAVAAGFDWLRVRSAAEMPAALRERIDSRAGESHR